MLDNIMHILILNLVILGHYMDLLFSYMDFYGPAHLKNGGKALSFIPVHPSVCALCLADNSS